MNEYRVQRLKEDLTYAQQRNKQQKKQLANYKKVHEKDLKEIERLNNIIDKKEQFLVDNIKRLEREVVKRDNIINELERHLEQQYLEWKDDSNDEICAMADEDKCILEKLRELKGDSSNE